ncbi:MAG: hypothetical protein JST54_17300 [Deltaproteobacteria bacterium]|nr:hypothetical protein [Deltaproteobacteria bacterium]
MRRRALLGALGLLALFGIKTALTRPPPRGSVHTVHGVYHVHSNRSDGSGSPDDIAAAAAKAGLDFVVMTDHNRLDPDLLGVKQGVLIIPATEESTNVGHVVSLGATRPLLPAEMERPLGQIRRLHGAPVLAHPLNRKMPFIGWSEQELAIGMEALSYDDLWREALHAPLSRGLVVGSLELPFNSRLAVAQLIRRPDAALAKWDALRHDARIVQLCAVDAHGWPGYAPVFQAMSMYLDHVTPPLEPNAVLAALESGHAYCGLDAVAPADGFGFVAMDAKGQPPLGEGEEGETSDRTLRVTLPSPAPKGAKIKIYRDGVAQAEGQGPELQLSHAVAGDWRVEVWAPLPGAFFDGPDVPWILSNVIRLQ